MKRRLSLLTALLLISGILFACQHPESIHTESDSTTAHMESSADDPTTASPTENDTERTTNEEQTEASSSDQTDGDATEVSTQAVTSEDSTDGATSEATTPPIPSVEDMEGVPMEELSTYTNPILTCQSESAWPGYGFGDPFVMRYNGMYYLYVSTKDGSVGVKCWSSADLVNWKSEGFCTNEKITTGAYAPEVYYYNGYFYMYTSPAGNGHYVLRSTSPTKGFEVVTGNMGMSIDGSVFIDNDGKWYFYTAGNGAMQVYDMTSPMQMRSGRTVSSVSVNGGWTEGGMVVYHDGYYYMTYTGNHVLSPSYRILYGVSDKTPLRFDKAEENNPPLISTSGDVLGIGHSSTVKGPDLDSYYIVYHSLVDTLPNRNMNIDRIHFNGEIMEVLGPTTDPQQVPDLPDVYHYFAPGSSLKGWSLTGSLVSGTGLPLAADSMLVSKTPFAGDFTAEYNITSISEGGQAGAIFAYTDANNFGACYFTPSEQKVIIEITVNGEMTRTEVDTIRSFGEDTRFDCLQSLQIERQGQDYTFYMNDRLLCTVTDSPLTGGSIGYMTKSAVATFGFIGGTGAVGGRGGADQYKTVSDKGGFIPATENIEGHPTITMAGGVQTVEIMGGETLSYRILPVANGMYDLSVLCHGVGAERAQAEVFVDGVSVGQCELAEGGKTATAVLRGISLTHDTHCLSIRLTKGTVRVESLTVCQAVEVIPLTVTFTKDAENPAHGVGAWEIADGKLTLANSRSCGKVLYGSPNWGDYTVEVTVTPTASPNCGLLVRATNPGAPTFLNAWPSASDAATATDWVMGYFIGLTPNGVVIGKQSYSYNEVASASGTFQADKTYHLKAVCEGNRILVYVDGELYLDYTDPRPYMQGMVGVRTHNCPVIFDDFRVTSHE